MKINGWNVGRPHDEFAKTHACALSSILVSAFSLEQAARGAGRARSNTARHPRHTGVLSIMILLVSVACLMGCSGITSAGNHAPSPINILQIQTQTLPPGTVNAKYSTSLTATGGVPPYTWHAAGAGLPTGLTLTAATGVISGTPAQAGSFAFMAQVQDSHSDAYSRSVALSIATANSPLHLATTSLPAGTMNANYSATLSATGGTPPYSWTTTSGQLPSGLALNAATGTIGGIPSQAGTFPFTAQVTDSKASIASSAISMNIAQAQNLPLQLTTTSLPVGTINASYSTTLTATGGTPPYSWHTTAGQLPPAVTLSAATGVIAGTPSQAGTFSFTAQVTDSKAANASAGLSLNVSTAAAPMITTVSPNTGATAGGTAVTVSGSGFQAGATVQFGNTPAVSAQVTNSTQIQVTTPTEAAGSVNVSVTNTDGQVATDTSAFTFASASPSGPILPALPQATVNTTFPSTSGYTVTNVTPGQLQAAINNASCNPNGTILQLPAGSVDNEAIILPLKSCASGQWIIITTNGVTLPSQGTRIDPSVYAGQLAKITQSVGNPPIVMTAQDSPVNHYWLSGLEIEDTGFQTNGIVNIGGYTTVPANFPSFVIIDRCYIHGRAATNTARDVSMHGSNLAVVDSYLSEAHEVGSDAQAIASFSAPGPILIQNNFLEGSGENVLFGGAGLATNNAPYNVFVDDATLRGNFFYKPVAWRSTDASYMGIHWTIKNLLETKEGVRVLIENNVLENNWADAQTGDAVLFTPTEQSGVNTVLQDVTFRNNTIRHIGSGFQITGRSADDYSTTGDPLHRTDRILIQNNLLDDVKVANWSGNGRMLIAELGVNGLTVDHNTVSWLDDQLVFASDDLPETAFFFTNNIAPAGQYGFMVNNNGVNNVAAINQWLSNPTISNNVIAGAPSGLGLNWCSLFFTSNQCPAALTNVGFASYNNGTGGDYRLCSGSGTPSGSCGGASSYAAGQKFACAANTDCGANVAQLQQLESQAAVFPATVPTISVLSSSSMACNGANSLTISGTNLNLPGTDVLINGTVVTPKSQPTLTSIVVVPPSASGVTVPVTVDNFGLPVTLPLTCQ